jgi:hypothetical protein
MAVPVVPPFVVVPPAPVVPPFTVPPLAGVPPLALLPPEPAISPVLLFPPCPVVPALPGFPPDEVVLAGTEEPPFTAEVAPPEVLLPVFEGFPPAPEQPRVSSSATAGPRTGINDDIPRSTENDFMLDPFSNSQLGLSFRQLFSICHPAWP